ncbi:MAG: LacI family DNA-binding transcriptional regulator [Acetobacteraceae bacterium]
MDILKSRVTIRDVAAAATVSLGTVSRVVNGNRSVREPARTRVLQVMERLGYVPDAVAQSLRTQSTRSVGCVVSDVSNPLFSTTVSAAENALSAAGYTMMLTASHDSTEREVAILTLFGRRRLDGMIMTISREADERIGSALHGFRGPVVLLERELPFAADTVLTDHYEGTHQALEYLLALGHRRIGLITVTEQAFPGRERGRAFREALRQAGISEQDAPTAFHGFSAEYGYRMAHQFLASPQRPTAILAGAGQMVGVIRAARTLGLQLPADLSLISFGDTDLAELHSPPLTVVRWDNARTGRVAAELLLARLSSGTGDSKQRIVLPSELIVRRSCKPPMPATT